MVGGVRGAGEEGRFRRETAPGEAVVPRGVAVGEERSGERRGERERVV